jgi:hypothetical protein
MATNKAAESSEKGHLRPFEGRYSAMLPAAVMSLVPFIITSTAWDLFRKDVGKATGAGTRARHPTELPRLRGTFC